MSHETTDRRTADPGSGDAPGSVDLTWTRRLGAGAGLVAMTVAMGAVLAAALVTAIVFIGLLASAALN